MRQRHFGFSIFDFGLLVVCAPLAAMPGVARAADPQPVQNQGQGERGEADEHEPAFFDASEFLRRAAAAFTAADRDQDDRVTRDEFVASYHEFDRAERERRFDEFDSDRDGKLNRDEFLKLLSPTDERGEVRDPIVEIERGALAKWRAAFAAADRDGDGSLSGAEWPGRQIARDVPELAGLTFERWDHDRNGNVDDVEGRWLLEVAYGLAQLDGRPIRKPTGRVFSWYYFRAVDQNHDGVLSRDEFVSQFYQGKEKNAATFAEVDRDQNGELTAEETLTLLWHDTLAHFFIFDRDRDGFMTTEEFLKIGYARHVALRSVRAFDDNGDGKISFGEFRETTFANQASDWPRMREDADGDGRLSWDEFYIEKAPLLFAQSRWFFNRFDFNRDGFLSIDELEFDVSIDKVPPELLFAARDNDGNGKLAFTEVFNDPKPPDPSALDRFELRLAAAENRFLADDRDSSGDLDLEEFTASQQAARDAARREAKVLSDRKTMLEGNYYVRKGVLVVNELVFLAIVWMVVRRTGRRSDTETRGQGDKEKDFSGLA